VQCGVLNATEIAVKALIAQLIGAHAFTFSGRKSRRETGVAHAPYLFDKRYNTSASSGGLLTGHAIAALDHSQCRSGHFTERAAFGLRRGLLTGRAVRVLEKLQVAAAYSWNMRRPYHPQFGLPRV